MLTPSDAPEPSFSYESGFLARLFASGCVTRLTLSRERLVCALGHVELNFEPNKLSGEIALHKGLVWSTITFGLTDDSKARLGGIRRADAEALKTAMDRWLEPVRVETNARLSGALQTISDRLNRLLDGSSYLKKSQIRACIKEASGALEDLRPAMRHTYVAVTSRQLFSTLESRIRDLATEAMAANQKFVARTVQAYGALFDSVEAKPLTDRQREACVINDDNNLVLAGAGTGKTSVIVGRVAYLVKSGLARPDEILLLAYNRDAAKELRERLRRRSVVAQVGDLDGIEARTFHALGRQLLGAALGKVPDVSVLATDESKLAPFMQEALEGALKEPTYAKRFVEYGFYQYEAHRSIFDFPDAETYERYIAQVEPRTLKGDRVKSSEELRIANFLTEMGVSYEYEAPCELPTADRFRRQYRPDFTIYRDDPDAPPVYLEHFGLDERGRPPSFFSPDEAHAYVESITWKRKLCREHGLALIETYSHEFRAGTVFANLTAQLKAHGITFRPKSTEECLEVLRQSAVVSSTARFFASLVPLARENGITRQVVLERVPKLEKAEQARSLLRWELLEPLLERYRRHLADRGEVDFSDMILRARELIKQGKVELPFKYILVDEFQDISGPRAELVKALAQLNPDTTLFCVGDDWQSIYRFAGSDIRYSKNFETMVGPGTTVALDRTFRFNNQLAILAAEFVGQNPDQTKKTIRSDRPDCFEPAVSLVPTAQMELGVAAVLEVIGQRAIERGCPASVYVLGRYNYELDSLRSLAKTASGRYPGVKSVALSSVHASKGLEADYVLVVGLRPGKSGFPADKAVDAFHDMFLPPREEFPFAEERRLFYVALTRARERVYLVFDGAAASPFVHELHEGGYFVAEDELHGRFVSSILPRVPCPRCRTGQISPRSGPNGTFYGCNRFPRCRYTERGCGTCGSLLIPVGEFRVCSSPHCDGVHPSCPRCGSPMEQRSGPYGRFYGCSKYGARDVSLQCAGTRKTMSLPSAASLRTRSSIQKTRFASMDGNIDAYSPLDVSLD